MAPAPATTGAAAGWPSPRQAWYAVFIFGLTLLVNFLDRGIITLLVEPLKHDLGLSDEQVGVLMGLAFVCFYVVLGLPIARLVDSVRRATILTVGLACWSVATALCGLAGSFGQLFAFRVGVGVGEACSGPATYSMLADLFPPWKLPRAIAFMQVGFFAGNAAALIVGGAIVTLLLALPPMTLPLVGTLHGWQLAFLLASVPGLIVTALLFTLREPPRRGDVGGGGGVLPLGTVLAYLKSHGATFGPIYLGGGITTLTNLGAMSWQPTFFIREFGWSPARVGLVSGLMYLTVWPLGTAVGTWMVERLQRQGRDDANMRIVIWSTACAVPFLAAAPLMPTGALAMTVQGCGLFCGAWLLGPQNAALQIITPNRMRGQVTALFLFVFNVIGFGLGPSFIALTSTHVFGGGTHALGHALALTQAVMGPITVLVFAMGLKAYGRSVVAARAWEAAAPG
ncbi:MAG: MFS transporter [Steroidobacteraceae bacterium]